MPIKTYRGFDIFLDINTGLFSTTIGGAIVERLELPRLERRIDREFSAIDAIIIRPRNTRPIRDEVIEFEGGRVRTVGGNLLSRRHQVLLFDQAIFDQLESYHTQLQTILTARQTLIDNSSGLESLEEGD